MNNLEIIYYLILASNQNNAKGKFYKTKDRQANTHPHETKFVLEKRGKEGCGFSKVVEFSL